MPVTDVTHDLDTRTITIVADFAAPVDRVWDVYADPRQLEKVWGPPGYPATFVDHELAVGGRMNYYMTGPDGERYYGYWEVTGVDAGSQFTFDDGFALDEQFTKNPDLPVSANVYAFAEHAGGTRATFHAVYPSAEALEKVLEMGMLEGASAAMAQVDDLLAA